MQEQLFAGLYGLSGVGEMQQGCAILVRSPVCKSSYCQAPAASVGCGHVQQGSEGGEDKQKGGGRRKEEEEEEEEETRTAVYSKRGPNPQEGGKNILKKTHNLSCLTGVRGPPTAWGSGTQHTSP